MDAFREPATDAVTAEPAAILDTVKTKHNPTALAFRPEDGELAAHRTGLPFFQMQLGNRDTPSHYGHWRRTWTRSRNSSMK